MKISLKTKITIHLKGIYPHWLHSGDLERFGMAEGQKGETTGRRARELAASGVLERKEVNGSVLYRYKTQDIKTTFRPEFISIQKQLTTKLF